MTKKYTEAEREADRIRASRETRPPSGGPSPPDASEQKLLALARDFYEAGNYDSARKVLEVLIGMGHKGGYAYFMLARSYGELGQAEKAMSYYKLTCDFYEPVQPKPKYYLFALNNMGALLREEKRYGEARIVYERAQVTDPEYAPAHYNLGILYADYLDDKRLALEHFQRYLDLKGERSSEVENRIRKIMEAMNPPVQK